MNNETYAIRRAIGKLLYQGQNPDETYETEEFLADARVERELVVYNIFSNSRLRTADEDGRWVYSKTVNGVNITITAPQTINQFDANLLYSIIQYMQHHPERVSVNTIKDVDDTVISNVKVLTIKMADFRRYTEIKNFEEITCYLDRLSDTRVSLATQEQTKKRRFIYDYDVVRDPKTDKPVKLIISMNSDLMEGCRSGGTVFINPAEHRRLISQTAKSLYSFVRLKARGSDTALVVTDIYEVMLNLGLHYSKTKENNRYLRRSLTELRDAGHISAFALKKIHGKHYCIFTTDKKINQDILVASLDNEDLENVITQQKVPFSFN
ncbi:MAG: hypothetical protein ACYC69_02685 [Thermodesulfovibrionales bacterium]